MYIGKKKERFIDKIRWQTVVNVLSIIVGLVTIIAAIYIFLFVEERVKWLPFVFMGAALVNFIEGCKKFYYGRRISGIFYFLAMLVVTAFAVISYIVLWKPV